MCDIPRRPGPPSRRTAGRLIVVHVSLMLMWVTGCGVNVEPLMPTPLLFTEGNFGPLDHIPANEQWTPRRVYYATNRERGDSKQTIAYGNDPSDEVSLGLAFVGFGDRSMSWSALNKASMQSEREEPVSLSIAGVVEAAHFDVDATTAEAALPDQAGFFIENINEAIEGARDKDVIIYVHGAKVNFYNACAFAAQLDHFTGRDMTSVGFSWPTRQDIFAYAWGTDRKRAYESASALAALVDLLAQETPARRIHIIAWSAGARVLMRTFTRLRERYPEESEEALRERYRIATAYFAAGDVPTDEFLEELPTVNALASRVIVTVTSQDMALQVSNVIIGGGNRIGQANQELTDEQIETLEAQDRLEIINVSEGAKDRGFDITGHGYWFHHPWASTDVLLSIRTDLAPAQRGLVTGEKGTWMMPPDYPKRLAESLKIADFERW